MRIQKHK